MFDFGFLRHYKSKYGQYQNCVFYFAKGYLNRYYHLLSFKGNKHAPKSHKKYLKPEHYDIIKKIYGYDFDDNKEGLIDEDEFIKILHEHIGFEGLLTSFDCR
ncbi:MULTISPECIES: hypothetical protein [unclassified Moraxella]|jgi:hypothetical protein|uniref:hypothetical protein n=1 Tax=unclassified Moraxella TaxID=2685852 RepID=UPI00188130BA|nr:MULTISPECIES: hypothetical protein [unclassified Moraxella]MBE9577642.1 hypothetical protein [Moraxella sp. K1664]MBE9587100.1 hypothetical protein [Moraxella sp. K1630]MBE9595338.1 hypothetical protein [Moraxella sp. K2450]